MEATAVALLNNLGLLSLGAVALFLIATRVRGADLRGWRAVLLGLLLGAVSFLVVKMPIPSPLGASFDTRAAPLVLAGFLGGGPAGLAAATLAAVARYSVGGPAALGGMVSVFLYAGAGWAGAAVAGWQGRRRMGVAGWAVLAVAATVAVLPSFFVGQPVERALAILRGYWPLLATGNLLGIVLLGLVVEEVQGFIAERNRHREQLHLSDLARTVARVGQWRHDPRADRMDWDDAQFAIMGVERDGFPGTLAAFRERVHPDDWPDLARRIAEARASLGSYDARVRIVTPDGDLRHIRLSATCVGGEPGDPETMVGLTMDETDDVALRAELELKGAALDSASNGIVVASADAGQPIVHVNRAFTEITGYESAEAIGRNCRFLNGALDPEDEAANAEALAQVREALRTGDACEVLLRNRRKDGTLFWNALRLSAIRDGLGVVTHFIGVQDDVSDAVAGRRKLEELSADLARQLKAAEAANEAKSRFLSVISHELRTPLNGVLGMAQLLKRTPIDPKQARFVNAIIHAGGTLHRIVEDILDLTMMDAGRLDLDLAEHGLRPLVERVVDQVAAAHGVPGRIAVDLAPGLDGATLVTDGARLEQVLANLLDNALKFGLGRPVTVTVAPRGARQGLSFSVRDDGIGIHPDKHDLIFHRFTQADQGPTRGFGGAGLGLSICREIVTALGGTIGVTSVPGRGATFAVDLPCALSAAQGPEDNAAPVAAAPFDVVVVDDDPVSATMIAALAESLGRRCLTYLDAEAALQASTTWRRALVFTDLHMPGLSGEGFVQRLRASGVALTGIVMVTADMRETRTTLAGMGVDLGLHKPLDLDRIARIIADPSILIAPAPVVLSA